MKSLKDKMHTFIVRIWLEPREIEGKHPEWRGVIEHVEDGKRQYFRNLEDLMKFIASYVQEMRLKASKVQQALSRLTLWGSSLWKE